MADGALWNTHRLISKVTSVSGGRTADFVINAINANALQDVFTVKGNGETQLNKYGVGTFAGSAAYLLGVDGSGNLVETSGGGEVDTYTPTSSNEVNLDSVIFSDFQYCATLDSNTGYYFVTISGMVELNPTSVSTVTRVDFNVPLVASFSSANDCGGSVVSEDVASQCGRVKAVAGTNRIRVEFIAVANSTTVMSIHFSYIVFPG